MTPAAGGRVPGTLPPSPETLDRVSRARCPECGREVFVPDMRRCGDRENPTVACRDLCHWTGRLDDCPRGEPPDRLLDGIVTL